MSSQIPARLIQTAKNRDLPMRARAAVVNLKSLNPDFEHLFFDDAQVVDFIQKEFPKHREVFDSFPFRIQKYDFFRYLAVYRFGGFYFDTDVFFATGLSALLAHGCVFPFEELTLSRYLREQHQMDWEIGNYGFGSAAGHPFLEAVIENCVRAQRDSNWVKPMMEGIPRWFRADFQVLNTTGPGLLTRTLAENAELAKDMTVLFPDDVCDQSKWHQFGNFGVHAMEGSWRTNGGFLRRRLGNIWETRAKSRGLIESHQRGKTRSLPVKSDVPQRAGVVSTALSVSQP